MTSSKLGTHTKEKNSVSVEDITPYGIWIQVTGKEYFLDYENFPWFQEATVRQIHELTFSDGFHLRWPNLDVDIHLDSLTHLEQYPLIFESICTPHHIGTR
jgi:hypothetical protein